VDIERTARRDVQYRLRKDEPVSSNDYRLGRGGPDSLNRLRGLQRLGLENLQPSGLRESAYRTRDRMQATAAGTVGRGKDQGDLVPCLEQA
jgi:hypothetical protein